MPQAPETIPIIQWCRSYVFIIGPGAGFNSSPISSQYSCTPRASRLGLSCSKYSALMDLRSMYVFPVRNGCLAAGCSGCGGAGHAPIRSGSKLLLFLVLSPLFSLNGLPRSVGLSFPSLTALRATNPMVVMSADTLGSWSFQGLYCITAFLSACGCGGTCQPGCSTGVLIAVRLRTFPPLVVESKELAGEPKSFSGTGGGETPRWRMTGVRLRRFRSQKYAKIVTAMSKTAIGIIASPAIEVDESRCPSPEGVEASDGVASIVELLVVDVVSKGIVNCCSVEIVACCMRMRGSDDEAGSDVYWNCATRDGSVCVDVCDADRPSICSRTSFERSPFIASIVAARHLSPVAPPTITEEGPLQSLCLDVGATKIWGSYDKDAVISLVDSTEFQVRFLRWTKRVVLLQWLADTQAAL